MNLIKTAVLGALGCMAWRAWQQRRSAAGSGEAGTPRIGKAVHDADTQARPSVGEPARPAVVSGAQSSRGYGVQ